MAEIKFYLQKYLSEFRQRLNDNTLKLNDIHAILSFFDKMNHTSYCKRDRLSQREADSILKVNFNSLKTAYNDWKNRNNTTYVKANTVNNSYQCDNTNIDKYKEMEKASQELLKADDYAYGEVDESTPKKCECGGKIITKLYAEPVRECEKCGKYYGTIPFKRKMNENRKSKSIIITEEQLNYIQNTLNEGKDRKQQARKKTRNVIIAHFNNSPMLNEPNEFTNGLTLLDYLEQDVIHTWFHSRERQDAKGYFITMEPNICKIALECGWQQDKDDTEKLTKISEILNYVEMLYKKGDTSGIQKVTNANSFDDIYSMFNYEIKVSKDAENKRLNNMEYGEMNQDYEIVKDLTFEQANEIGNYSVSKGKLCYTQGKSTWQDFTNGGKNKVYCCLKKGWKQIPERHGRSLLPQYPNTNAYDEYGLSMIFLFVSPDGDLMSSNTRWNHNATYGNGRSVDQAFTKEDISRLLNVNFNNFFVGYTSEELEQKGPKYISFNQVQSLLDGGANPEEIFDEVCEFKEGFSAVEFKRKWNFINKEGQILSPNQWFDYCWDFNKGWAIIKLNKKFNFINTKGQILSPNQWFDFCRHFKEGFAKVALNGKTRYIDTNGNLYDTIPQQNISEKKIKNKNIILTESQMNYIKEHLNEDGKAIIKYFVEPEKTLIIKKFLDDNFVKAGMPMISPEGYPTTMPIVGLKGTDGQVAKNMTDKQLFFMLQDKFLKMYTDIDRRDRFLKQLIKDWYYDKISKEGLLSVNEY